MPSCNSTRKGYRDGMRLSVKPHERHCLKVRLSPFNLAIGPDLTNKQSGRMKNGVCSAALEYQPAQKRLVDMIQAKLEVKLDGIIEQF